MRAQKDGILEGVDAALAYQIPVGSFLYNSSGPMVFSVDGFRIKVQGKGTHGAYPHSAIDPINIVVHIYWALETLIAREAAPGKACIMTTGNFSAGTAANIIPDLTPCSGISAFVKRRVVCI